MSSTISGTTHLRTKRGREEKRSAEAHCYASRQTWGWLIRADSYTFSTTCIGGRKSDCPFFRVRGAGDAQMCDYANSGSAYLIRTRQHLRGRSADHTHDNSYRQSTGYCQRHDVWRLGWKWVEVTDDWISIQCKSSVTPSDLALIGRVLISSPTPSTSTTSASLYLLTVLAHSVTCAQDTQAAQVTAWNQPPQKFHI